MGTDYNFVVDPSTIGTTRSHPPVQLRAYSKILATEEAEDFPNTGFPDI